MIQAIIFDCFGVIITDGLQLLCDQLSQRQPERVADLRSIIHAANRGIIASDESSAKISATLGIPIDEYRRQVTAHEVKNLPLLDSIRQLRDTHKTGLLSNITVEGLARRFSDEELAKYFDTIIVSSDVGFAKPDPEIYHIAAQRLGVVPADCVFIDDREPYCDGASAVGMKTILYQGFGNFQVQLKDILEGQ